jgi:hypothetical protein
LSTVEKWQYESDEAFEERLFYLDYWLDSFGPEQFEWFSNLSKEERNFQKRVILNSLYRKQYEDKLEQFFNKWQEMKKLYLELIELYCKDNYNTRIWLEEAIDSIQQDLKEYHKFTFTEALSRYVSEHFIDKKTEEYLIKKYGNDVNHNLGFEEWREDLKKTPKQRKYEEKLFLEQCRENTKRWCEQSSREEESEQEYSDEDEIKED